MTHWDPATYNWLPIGIVLGVMGAFIIGLWVIGIIVTFLDRNR